jgi:hypothetical protein
MLIRSRALSKTRSGGISLPEGEGENGTQGQNQDQSGDPGAGSTGAGTQGTSTGNEPKTPEGTTFSEEQLDRIIGKRAKEAEKSAKQATEAAIAEQLGISSGVGLGLSRISWTSYIWLLPDLRF